MWCVSSDPKRKLNPSFKTFYNPRTPFPRNGGIFQRLTVTYLDHSLWEMILPAQIYSKFNFRPSILRFHKRKQMAEAKPGLLYQRRGERREAKCHNHSNSLTTWLPTQWTRALAPRNFKSNFSGICFSFEIISGSFWSSKLKKKKKSKKSVSLEY